MRSALWRIIAGILLIVVAAACWRWQAARSHAGAPPSAQVEIAGENFEFDRRYLSPGRADGAVELAAFFPNFAPAATTDDISARTDVGQRFRRLVFVELKPADEKLDPAERTVRLYLRFLGESSSIHPGGLTARPFEPDSPFEGDELFFVAPEGRLFAARCHRSDANVDLPNTCIAAFRSGAVDAQIRFSADLLSEWETLMKGARGLIDASRK